MGTVVSRPGASCSVAGNLCRCVGPEVGTPGMPGGYAQSTALSLLAYSLIISSLTPVLANEDHHSYTIHLSIICPLSSLVTVIDRQNYLDLPVWVPSSSVPEI